MNPTVEPNLSACDHLPGVPLPPEFQPVDAALEHAFFVTFLETVPDHVYFKDRESRFLAVSRSLAAHLGKAPRDVIGKTDFDFFTEDYAWPAYDDEQHIMRTGGAILDKLERQTWSDGSITFVLTSKMPLRNAAGAIVGTFGISKDVTQAKATEATLEKTRRELIDASRLAGMAEVATGVLHNVGNVLVSVNVTTDTLADALRNSRVAALGKLAALLREHTADLGDYLTRDPKGRLVPEFLATLATHLATEQAHLLQEVESLRRHVAHIKDIVTMQQDYARLAGVVEPLDPAELFEDALRMNSAALARHEVTVIRDFHPLGRIVGEKGKVLQILVNLIRNAKYACDEGTSGEKVLTLRIAPGAPGRVHLVVSDTGIGIPSENLTRIFAHGFTTRSGGHGFGLHSSANAAREMQGSLAVHSDGLGTGATFTLDLPREQDVSPADPAS